MYVYQIINMISEAIAEKDMDELFKARSIVNGLLISEDELIALLNLIDVGLDTIGEC